MALNQFLDFDPFFIRIIFGFNLILDCFRQKLKKRTKSGTIPQCASRERLSFGNIFGRDFFSRKHYVVLMAFEVESSFVTHLFQQ